MKRILFILMSVATLTTTTVVAQQDFTLYHMNYVPQVQYTNPSTLPKMKWYYSGIFVPLPTNAYMSFSHSGLTWNQAINGTGSNAYFDMDNIVKSLGKKNYVTAVYNHELINFGFKAKESYWSFATNFKNYVRLTYPGDLITLINEGNGQSLMGQRADFNDIGIDVNSYLEFSLNYARNLSEKLTIGARPKLLWGAANLYTEYSQIGVATDAKTFDITLDGKMKVNGSGPIGAGLRAMYTGDSSNTFGDMTKVLDNTLYSTDKNWGGAIDLGATMEVNDQLTLSASLIDLGFIRWKNQNFSIISKDVQFKFEGIDVVEAYILGDSNAADPFAELADSIQGFAKFDSASSQIYSTQLPAQIYVGGKYEIAEQTYLTMVGRTAFNRGRWSQSASLGINTRVKKWLGAGLNWSAYNRDLFNVGAGFAWNFGPFQFYLASDNILSVLGAHMWSGPRYQKQDMTDQFGNTYTVVTDTLESIPLYSYREKNMHGRFGFNMTFGRQDKDSDNDKIIDKKDKCPNTFGLERFQGCPDTDDDDIPDPDDGCPLEAGTLENNGCPDSDLDGIINSEDECPMIPGILAFKGCPDVDGDSIPDKDDKCPKLAGPKSNNGCPLTSLKMINSFGDTIANANKNEDQMFVYRNINPLQDLDFYLKGEDSTLGGELVVILLDEDEAMRMRTFQDNKNEKLYHYYCPKVQAIDENGNIVGTAIKGKDGKYIFKNLSPDHRYTFLAVGDPTRVPSDLDIIVQNDDAVIEMKTEKDSDNHKQFHYFPLKRDEEIRLNLLDENGEIVMSSIMDEKGMFIFKDLDPDKTYRFELKGSDPRLTDEVPVMYMTDDGIELLAASIQPDGKYLYKKLNKPLVEEAVVLKDEEKEVVDEAFAHLEFESALTVIKEHSLPSLNQLAKLLIKHPDWKLHITGHTDNVGSDEDNMKLSERRAKAVELYFAQEGVPASKLIVEWHGEEQPIESNDTPDGRQKNRRVEMNIVKTK